jgi:hypothetical protein
MVLTVTPDPATSAESDLENATNALRRLLALRS